jgi:hypothetical protein
MIVIFANKLRPSKVADIDSQEVCFYANNLSYEEYLINSYFMA